MNADQRIGVSGCIRDLGVSVGDVPLAAGFHALVANSDLAVRAKRIGGAHVAGAIILEAVRSPQIHTTWRRIARGPRAER